jgi:glycerol-3-phosphate acyltransferase PlsY
MEPHLFVRLLAGFGIAYAVGCISTAYYLVFFVQGRDIRNLETGTAGARNVSRILGRKAGAAVALIDIAKGVAAAYAGSQIAGSPSLSPLIMAAAIAGHIWPAQLGFRGGKGVATGFGTLLWLLPATAALAALSNLCFSVIFRSATLGTLLATALIPFFAYALGKDGTYALQLALPCGLVLFAHRHNILKLAATKTDKSDIR